MVRNRIARTLALIGAGASLVLAGQAAAADKLVISTWGGSFKELIEEAIGKPFTAKTGIPVEYVTGGTIDRLNKAKLAKAAPEADITFTTSHVGWLYAGDGLFETLDLGKVPNAKHLVEQAKISPYHVGAWAYVYTIGYRPDLVPKGITFGSWEDLWKPELKGTLASPDFDPSHVITVSAMLSGGDAASWEKGQQKLLALKPNYKAFYTNDANSQQLISTGETPVQVMLSMNAYHMIGQGVPIKVVIPKEGAVLGIDAIGVMKGSKQVENAYRFIDVALSPESQAKIAEMKKGSPVVLNAAISKETAALPGVFTTAEQWKTQTIIIDHKLRAEKTAEWRKWFSENLMAR